MPKKNVPKKQWPQRKKQLLKILGQKRLTPTKMQRRQAREKFRAMHGYYPARLSQVVGKPSRHSVKAVNPKYEVISPGTRGYYKSSRYWGGEREWVPGEPVVRKIVGEVLVIKRQHKRKGAGKSSGSGNRGNHRTGTLKARRNRAKAAKKGMRFGKEKKKQKKKR